MRVYAGQFIVKEIKIWEKFLFDSWVAVMPQNLIGSIANGEII